MYTVISIILCELIIKRRLCFFQVCNSILFTQLKELHTVICTYEWTTEPIFEEANRKAIAKKKKWKNYDIWTFVFGAPLYTFEGRFRWFILPIYCNQFQLQLQMIATLVISHSLFCFVFIVININHRSFA